MEAYQSRKTNGPLRPSPAPQLPPRRNEEIWLLSYIIRNTTETKGMCARKKRRREKRLKPRKGIIHQKR